MPFKRLRALSLFEIQIQFIFFMSEIVHVAIEMGEKKHFMNWCFKGKSKHIYSTLKRRFHFSYRDSMNSYYKLKLIILL